MRRLLLILIGSTLALPALAAAPDRKPANNANLSPVQRLIADLGSDAFAVRRRAEEQLLRLGPEAFDELKLAESNPDLEIAERVKYIVQRMRVQWTRPDDPAEVRRTLARYGDLSDEEKRERLTRLARLKDGAGLPALCRIARFEPAPVVAREAALALIQRKGDADSQLAHADACRQEMGGSQRAPVQWIELHFRELAAPRETIAAWREVVQTEAALLTAKSSETAFSIVRELVDLHLDRCHELKLHDETVDALAAAAALIEEQLDRSHDPELRSDATDVLIDLVGWGVDYREDDAQVAALAWSLAWIIRNKEWDVLSPWEDRYGEQLKKNRKLLYFLAAADSRAGRTERADELAEQAFGLRLGDDDQRVDLAEAVANLGFIDWAEREFRRAIKTYPVLSINSLDARSNLGVWLHDREDYQGASELLSDFCDAVKADRAGKQKLLAELKDQRRAGPTTVAGVEARRDFYLACFDETQGRYADQRKHLEKAAAIFDKDPDVLIAMYRLRDADDQFRAKTRERIRKTSAHQLHQIAQDPKDPTLYNQWAWLISNTEGDQAKAVEFSKRSLELAPDEPSYLDTLGRCYFAVGDLENAIKSQRRAVELAPHYHVMKRQLKQFEEALAAKATKSQ